MNWRDVGGSSPLQTMRHTGGIIARQYQFHREPRSCVLSRIINAWCAVAQMVAAGLCAVRFCRIAVWSKAGDVGSNPARTFVL